MDAASVYQYSAVSKTWEVFVKNQIIDYATTDHAGVVQIGEGIDVTTEGVISINSDSVGSSDWDQNNKSGAGYIKNRTHYTGVEISSVSLDDTLLLDDDLYPKTRATGNSLRQVSYAGKLPSSDAWYVKISDDTPTVEELKSSDSYWVYEVATLNSDGTPNHEKEKLYFKNSVGFYEDNDGTRVSSVEDATHVSIIDRSGTTVHNVGPTIVYKPNAVVGSYTVKDDPFQEEDIILPEPGTYVLTHIWFGESTARDPEHTAYQFITEIGYVDDTMVKKLEWKYLPDNAASKEWVLEHLKQDVQGDWEETDANNPSYIKNKPFGELPIIDAYNEAFTTTDKQALVSGVGSKEKFSYTKDGETYTYVWIGDTFQSLTAVLNHKDELKIKNSDTGEAYAVPTTTTEIETDAVVVFDFVGLDETKMDASIAIVDGSLNYRRGVYLRVHTLNSIPTISHVWCEVTYTVSFDDSDDASYGWVGTLAEYELNRQYIADGTKVFITDDEEEYMSVTVNGQPLENRETLYAPVESGIAGQYLKSRGPNIDPIWQSPAQISMLVVENNFLVSNGKTETSYYEGFDLLSTSDNSVFKIVDTTNDAETKANGFMILSPGLYMWTIDFCPYTYSSSTTSGTIKLKLEAEISRIAEATCTTPEFTVNLSGSGRTYRTSKLIRIADDEADQYYREITVRGIFPSTYTSEIADVQTTMTLIRISD